MQAHMNTLSLDTFFWKSEKFLRNLFLGKKSKFSKASQNNKIKNPIPFTFIILFLTNMNPG